MFKRKICWLIVLLAGFKTQAQVGTDSSAVFTLQQCVELAIRNNVDVQKKGLAKESAHINLQQSRGNLLPSLNADIVHGSNQGRSVDPYSNSYIDQQYTYANYGLNSSVTLFNGGALQNSIRQNRSAYEASAMEEQQLKDNTTLNVILVYLQILTNEDLLTLAVQQQATSGKQVERLDILNKDGAANPNELYDLKGTYANDQVNVVTTRNNLNNAKLSLCQLLNIPYNKNIKVQRLPESQMPLLYDATSEQVYQNAEKNLAIIKAVDLRKESASQGVKVAKGTGFPTLYLSGGLYSTYSSVAAMQELMSKSYQPNGDYVTVGGSNLPVMSEKSVYNSNKISYGSQLSNNLNTSVSIGLKLPILNGFSNKNKIAQARILQKDAEITAKSTHIQLEQNVEQAYFNMTASQDKFQVLQLQQTAFQESFRIAEVKFNAGAITSVDYLIAKNNSDKSNINFVVAKYDLIIRNKVLDYYQGKQLW